MRIDGKRWVLITALLWLGFVAAIDVNTPAAYLFLAALAVTKVWIFGRMFQHAWRETKAIDAEWARTFATLDRIDADLTRREAGMS